LHEKLEFESKGTILGRLKFKLPFELFFGTDVQLDFSNLIFFLCAA
jgi:hypothetical protein